MTIIAMFFFKCKFATYSSVHVPPVVNKVASEDDPMGHHQQGVAHHLPFNLNKFENDEKVLLHEEEKNDLVLIIEEKKTSSTVNKREEKFVANSIFLHLENS